MMNCLSENKIKKNMHTFTVDASYNLAENKIGIGIIIQFSERSGRSGSIIEKLSETHSADTVLPKDMELFAIYRAINIASNRQYTHINVRSDYNHIRTIVKEDLKKGILFQAPQLRVDIFQLAQGFKEIKISYCPRRKNHIAHHLARKGALIAPKTKIENDEPDWAVLYQILESENDVPGFDSKYVF